MGGSKIMVGEMTKPKVFRSMAEFRQHFFPKEVKKEQKARKIKTILDKPKFTKKQEQDLAREMGL